MKKTNYSLLCLSAGLLFGVHSVFASGDPFGKNFSPKSDAELLERRWEWHPWYQSILLSITDAQRAAQGIQSLTSWVNRCPESERVAMWSLVSAYTYLANQAVGVAKNAEQIARVASTESEVGECAKRANMEGRSVAIAAYMNVYDRLWQHVGPALGARNRQPFPVAVNFDQQAIAVAGTMRSRVAKQVAEISPQIFAADMQAASFLTAMANQQGATGPQPTVMGHGDLGPIKMGVPHEQFRPHFGHTIGQPSGNIPWEAQVRHEVKDNVIIKFPPIEEAEKCLKGIRDMELHFRGLLMRPENFQMWTLLHVYNNIATATFDVARVKGQKSPDESGMAVLFIVDCLCNVVELLKEPLESMKVQVDRLLADKKALFKDEKTYQIVHDEVARRVQGLYPKIEAVLRGQIQTKIEASLNENPNEEDTYLQEVLSERAIRILPQMENARRIEQKEVSTMGERKYIAHVSQENVNDMQGIFNHIKNTLNFLPGYEEKKTLAIKLLQLVKKNNEDIQNWLKIYQNENARNEMEVGVAYRILFIDTLGDLLAKKYRVNVDQRLVKVGAIIRNKERFREVIEFAHAMLLSMGEEEQY